MKRREFLKACVVAVGGAGACAVAAATGKSDADKLCVTQSGVPKSVSFSLPLSASPLYYVGMEQDLARWREQYGRESAAHLERALWGYP